MIAFQLHAQPQKNVDNQMVTAGYTQKHLYANIPHRLQPYHKHNKYLCVQLDTCADVNLMPESVYKLVFNDPQTAKLAKNDINLPLFEGIGRFPGEPYHIHTNPSITPKQTPCRPIPVHLKQTFRQEIEKMLPARVIKPVHEATPWINRFVLVESIDKSTGKPKLCICLDPTNLNKAIIHEPYCFHTPEDIAHKPSDATVITVLDCSKGYWHQPLENESSFLTTFNTKIG